MEKRNEPEKLKLVALTEEEWAIVLENFGRGIEESVVITDADLKAYNESQKVQVKLKAILLAQTEHAN